MNCACFTDKLVKCKNKTTSQFCKKHSNLCRKIDLNFSCGKTAILSNIKPRVWFCCYKSELGVYKKTDEYKILRKINGENIVRLLTSGLNYIITKCYEGDLETLSDSSNNVLESSHSQIVTALTILQNASIVHSDIHPKNILWSRTEKDKIDGIETHGIVFALSDFEFAKSYDEDNVSYDKRIKIRKKYLLFDETREYILTSKRRKSDDLTKYVTSLKFTKDSIPIGYHEDLLSLKRCFLKYNSFRNTEYYNKFIKSFTSFCFLKPFRTQRKELFSAAELSKLIKNEL
jgi:Protein kinase domain.